MICPVVIAQKKSDREFDGLKGPVRKITEETVKLSEKQGKWVETEKDSVTTTIYDAAGKLRERITYDQDPDRGKLKQSVRSVFSYDAEGRRMEKEFSDIPLVALPGEGPIPKDEEPPPDVRTRDGATLTTEVDKFDESGNRVETITYKGTAKGAMVWRKTYDYNAQTRTRDTLIYDFRNRLFEKEIDKFDEQGNLIESRFFGVMGKGMLDIKSRYIDYQFDAKGNWIERTGLPSGIGKNEPTPVEETVTNRKITYF
jgi:hypothetical protein